MRINDDLSKPTVVKGAQLDWLASPSPGVDRRMLFRIGGEVARATSIVRYASGSAFPRHTHGGGEEIFVLEGTFQDEHGDYPAGTYFRNPPGTSHVPASKDGCTIFVRLWQYREGDREQLVRRPGEGTSIAPWTGATEARMLFDDGHEQVRLERFVAGAMIEIDNPRGLELLVVAGGIDFAGDDLEPQTWIRLPAGIQFRGAVCGGGATLWLKDAPLLHRGLLPLPQMP